MPTERQTECLLTISRLTKKTGYPPSRREISGEMGVALNSVNQYLDNLRKQGLVKWVKGAPRTLKITKKGAGFL